METQDNNVTLSGLEPGALHLVEIVAKVCGKEGSRTQLRVRTGKDLWEHGSPIKHKGTNRHTRKVEPRKACLRSAGYPFPSQHGST